MQDADAGVTADAYSQTEELPRWLHHYNWHRPHGGIHTKTPISRIALDQDNLLRLHN